MDKLRALKYFAKLADTLSFSKTAAHFDVPSSSVSRRIRDLEQELGVALLQRTTRSVQLTDLGRLYFADITNALQTIQVADELVGQQSQTPSGILRITSTPSYGEAFVIPALEQLRRIYPKIVIDLNLSDQIIDLSSNDLDIAIRTTSVLPDYVVARRLTQHQYILVASPDYLSRNQTPLVVADLIDHPALVYRGPNGILDWQAKTDGKWQPVSISPTYISNHGPSLVQAVRCGEGIAFMPRWGVAQDIVDGRLVEIKLTDAQLTTRGATNAAVYLLYHPPKFRIQKIRVAVDHLVAQLSTP